MSETKKLAKNDCPKCLHKFRSEKIMKEHFENCNSVSEKQAQIKKQKNKEDGNLANVIGIKQKTTKNKNNKNNKIENNELILDDSYIKLSENRLLLEVKNEKQNKNKEYVLSQIKKAHQILYEHESLDGESAMSDIMSFLFLRLIADKISDKNENGKIDLLNREYYEEFTEDEINRVFSYFKNLENLAKEKEEFIRDKEAFNDEIKLMGMFLKKHPILKQVFTDHDFIVCEKGLTIKKLIQDVICYENINEENNEKINLVNCFKENEDLIGDIYEDFINNYNKKNSANGQFFTPRKLMNIILEFFKEYIIEKINELKENEEFKIYDSCMATAGWLVLGFNKIKELKPEIENRILLSGGEIHTKTFQLGLMNIISTINKMPYNVQRGNSLTHIDNDKFDLVLTNPPFKTGLSFENIETNFNIDSYTKKNNIKIDDVYKLKEKSSPIQFLELDYFKLKEGGMCIIVLPYGELFSKKEKKNIDIRNYLIENFNITHIILCPEGIFTHTDIKTCVFVFKKDSTHKSTKEIKYCRLNEECSKIEYLTTVTNEDIYKEYTVVKKINKKDKNSNENINIYDYNSYTDEIVYTKSLYLQNYIKDEYILNIQNKKQEYEWVPFRKLFRLVEGKIPSTKVRDIDDIEDNDELDEEIQYDENDIVYFVTGAKEDSWKRIIRQKESYLPDGEYVFISHRGNGNKRPVKYFKGECNYSNLMSLLIINDKYKDKILIKFIYYYLLYINEYIEKNYQKGTCQKTLDFGNFGNILVPIGSIENQREVLEIKNKMEEEEKLLKRQLEELKKKNNSTF